MTIFIQTDDDERVLFDTEKAVLDYEGRRIKLTGRLLSFYDQTILVSDGILGEEKSPAKILVVLDNFTGMRLEIPMPLEVASIIGADLMAEQERAGNGGVE